MSRFKPHPSGILIGNTYKFNNYKKPWDCDKAIKEEQIRQMEVQAEELENKELV